MGGRGSKSSRGGGDVAAAPAEPAGPSKVQEKLATMSPAQQRTYNTIASFGDTGTTDRIAGIHHSSIGPLKEAGLIRDSGRRAEPPGWKRNRERHPGTPKHEITVYVAAK